MTTRLDKTIKREIELDGKLYTIVMSPEGVKITPKGGRTGQEISWRTILGGEADTTAGKPEGMAEMPR